MDTEDMQYLYIAAFRHALERRTCWVSEIIGAIRESYNLLTDDTRRLMAREIVECKHLGMECDVRMWWDLAEFLLTGGNGDAV